MNQPDPTPTEGPAIWDLVMEDMKARDHLGRQRYGTPLQAHNGRDALQDAYEEALDFAVYLKQALVEREGSPDRMPWETCDAAYGDFTCDYPHGHTGCCYSHAGLVEWTVP